MQASTHDDAVGYAKGGSLQTLRQPKANVKSSHRPREGGDAIARVDDQGIPRNHLINRCRDNAGIRHIENVAESRTSAEKRCNESQGGERFSRRAVRDANV